VHSKLLVDRQIVKVPSVMPVITFFRGNKKNEEWQ